MRGRLLVLALVLVSPPSGAGPGGALTEKEGACVNPFAERPGDILQWKDQCTVFVSYFAGFNEQGDAVVQVRVVVMDSLDIVLECTNARVGQGGLHREYCTVDDVERGLA